MNLENENLIKRWEELRLTAYLPTPNDKWTIGWGHTYKVAHGMTITEAEAEEYFDADVKWAVNTVNKAIKVPVTQNQFDAMVSLTFNIGASAFKTSTLLRKLNAGDYEGAAHEFPRWNKQKGKVLRGLVRRRAEEMDYFLDGHEDEVSPGIISGPDPLKSLLQSKEVIGGAAATLTGVGSLLGGLTPNAQVVLCVGLVAIGGFFVINRLVARKKGER